MQIRLLARAKLEAAYGVARAKLRRSAKRHARRSLAYGHRTPAREHSAPYGMFSPTSQLTTPSTFEVETLECVLEMRLEAAQLRRLRPESLHCLHERPVLSSDLLLELPT